MKLGRWVEGSESLRKLLREPLPENASPTVAQAYESATATLREVKPRIPTMKIVLTAPADTDFTVKVDGKEVADSVVGVALPTDPGEHEIEATAPGFLKAVSTVRAHGERVGVRHARADARSLQHRRTPKTRQRAPAAAASPATAPQPHVEPTSRPAHGTSTGKVMAYVSYTVAAAGLGVGIAFGPRRTRRERAPRRLPEPRLLRAQHDALDSAKTKGIISTVGFAVAGAGVTLGTVLLFTSGSSSSDKATSGSARPRHARGCEPMRKLGLGSIAVTGEF